METLDYLKLTNAVLPSVLRAAKIEMDYFTNGVAVEQKGDQSPVTAADREAEAVLLSGLWDAASGVPVVAEESASLGGLPRAGRCFFVVDPLDGTREFSNGVGEFTINIGLVDGDRTIYGLIYAPAQQRLFVTLSLDRSVEVDIPFMEDAPASISDLALKTLRVRSAKLDDLVLIESRSHRAPETEAFLAGYSYQPGQRSGSSLKFCLIARGDGDMYPRLGPTREWDTAAGQAILEAAGGAVVTIDGSELRYGKVEDGYYNPHFIALSDKSLLNVSAERAST